MQPLLSGAIGTPAALASSLPRTLSPRARMLSTSGPITRNCTENPTGGPKFSRSMRRRASGITTVLLDKTGTITIFTSIEDLIKKDIIRLKIELDNLEDDVYFSEKIGKDVADILALIEQAKEQLKFAESNLENKLFDDALQDIQIVSGLIKKAKKMIELSGKLTEGTKKDSTWDIGLKALLLLLILVIINVWVVKHKLKLKNSLKQYVIKKPLSKEEIEEKKKEYILHQEKTKRVLKLLETEFQEGVINSKAYKELKLHNENKLKTIERNLRKL